VTKNPDGSYSFSWLHVDSATGYIVDAQNCIVDLRGFEWAGIEFGDATSGGLNEQRLAWFNQTFNMNYIRLPLNVTWWNNDVFVPNAGLHYRAWIQQVIKWAETNGDYILLNRVSQYSTPPCGGAITYCPSQAEPDKKNPPLPTSPQDIQTSHYLDATKQFWNSIVPLYVNNPAVLYDDWNELHDLDPQTWWEVQNELISTIRAIHPRSLIMLGGSDYNNTINPLIDRLVPDFTQSNLVYDWHIYNGYTSATCQEPPNYMWTHWGTESNSQFSFAHTHGHGIAINEWGGCNDFDQYNQTISSYAVTNHIALSYYNAWNVFTVSNEIYKLTSNGLAAQAAYAKFP
jgi:Cellulase (glycosyl hydrolase family 5)